MAGTGSYARPIGWRAPVAVLSAILGLGAIVAMAKNQQPQSDAEKQAQQIALADSNLEKNASPPQRRHEGILAGPLSEANKYAEIAVSNTDKPSDLNEDVFIVADNANMVAAGARYKVDGIDLRVVADDVNTVLKIPTLTTEEKTMLGNAQQKIDAAKITLR